MARFQRQHKENEKRTKQVHDFWLDEWARD